MSDSKQVGESPSSEVANQFRSCRDLSDIISLYPPRALYLKPLAKVSVSVSLPQLKTPGKTISTWEVMEKVRALILPDEFASLKVAKSTLEFIRLEGDLRDRCRLPRVLARLDSQSLNLAGFLNVLKVRAAEAKDDFPTRHSWDSYFRDAKHMNELKPGERPDTIHITGLPVKWFIEEGANTPSELLITKIFKKWGTLRRVDVPAADPYRSRMRLGGNIHKFSYEDGIFFDAYIQYIEYMDFVTAITALRGMKLLKKDDQNSLTATIKVDFDKTKHMNDSSVSHREFERKRLIAQDSLAAEKLRKKEEMEKRLRDEQKKKEETESIAKANRQRKREEKRKRKALTVFRKQEEDKVSMKIAREEQKLIKAQRQLESIRLLDELFDRIKVKVERKEIQLNQIANMDTKKEEKRNDEVNESANKSDSDSDKNDQKKKETKKKKTKKEKKKKLKKKRKKTQKKRKKDDDADTSSITEDSDKITSKKRIKSVLMKNVSTPSSSAATNFSYPDVYPDSILMPRIDMMRMPMSRYQPISFRHHPILSMLYRGGPRGRGGGFSHGRGRGFNSHKMNSRGFSSRGELTHYALSNPYMYDEQYYKYFAHLAGQDSSDRQRELESRSTSRTKTRSDSKTRSRSGSRSRSRRRNSSHSKSRRGSRSRSKSRSRSSRSSRSGHSKNRRKVRSTSDSRQRSSRKSASRSASRTRIRSGSKTKARNTTRRQSGSSRGSRSLSRFRVGRSRSRSRSRRRSRSRSHSRSRDNFRKHYRRRRSGRSASTVRVTRARSRTKSPRQRSSSSSWSLPKSSDRRSCSWSRTAPAHNNDEDGNKVKQQKESAKATETQK